MQIQNIETMAPEYTATDCAGLVTKALGAAAGSEKLYINIDSVEPGMYSAKYHSHTKQEEFFLILEGSGTLRLNNKQYPVAKGNFIAKPAGKNIAHTFYNSGSGTLIILDAGTVEPFDECYYPDEGITLRKDNGKRSVCGPPEAAKGWSSEPNAQR